MIEALFFVVGALVSWGITHIYHLKQQRESVPMAKALVNLMRKVESGSMTTDEASREIIKALETGALKPADFSGWDWTYKFCPECKGEVEVKGWSADEYNAFGGTVKCKNPQCGWMTGFDY